MGMPAGSGGIQGIIMKLSELHEAVNFLYDHRSPHDDPEVVVKVKMPFATVGGTSHVKVKDVYNGFDWDDGKFFLIPEENVTPADVDFAAKFKKLQDDHGWAIYENRNLKAENKRLNKQLQSTKDTEA